MKFLRQLRSLFRKEKLDTEMSEEMRAHLEMQAAENEKRGLSAREAHYDALRAFGGVEQIKERARDERLHGWIWLEQTGQDLRYAVRQLRRNPGFAAIAIAILAIGIGAATAMFSVVDGMILKPLPYEQPGRLMQLFESARPGSQNSVSPGVFFDWREQATAFESLAAYQRISLNFTGDNGPERVGGMRISANGLQVLRAQPVVGRIFAPDEDQPGRAAVMMLTQALWQRRFGGDPSVIGRPIRVDDQNYTVIGVLPDGFLPFQSQEFVVPLVMDAKLRDQRDGHWLRVVARLKPNVTVEQAQAELELIAQRERSLFPAWKKAWSATVVPMQEQLVQGIKPSLLVLLASVGIVMLIACANVANLLLAKAAARRREIAVRAALGAGRGRIMRQLLAESLLLALAGAGVGLLLAFWSVDGLRSVLGGMSLARVHEIAVDGRVLGATAVMTLLTGVGFGLAPAWQASRIDLNDALQDAARGSAGSGNRVRGALIVGEVALALVLLVGAGLLLHSFERLLSVSPGFDPARALTFNISLSNPKIRDAAQRALFFHRVAESLGTLPGVEAASLTDSLPLSGASDVFFRIAGRGNQPPEGYDVQIVLCTPDHFRALGVPLVRGRAFTADEAHRGGRVAIINATFAREFFPGEDPIGRQLERDREPWEIIGVVGDVRMDKLSQRIQPLVYRLTTGPSESWSTTATVVVRTRTAPETMIDLVRKQIAAIDSSLPITNLRTLDQTVTRSVADRRLTLVLLAGFAVVALLLSAVGLYGVIAYLVTQRTREFGIRMALGARRGDVVRLVLAGGLKLVALGLVLGLAGAFSLSHLLTKLLYEITPTDPLTFAGVSLVLLAAAALACWLPARRAAKVNPMVALRCE